jgi:cbb3-type cytochrome c oxidase subunit III
VQRVLAGAVLALAAGLLAAGCGTGGRASSHPDTANGEKLFKTTGQCAACHTLAAAGSSGTIGPNLDDAFRADRTQGFKQSTIQNIVLDQIRLGSGPLSTGASKTAAGTPMPANLVTGQDAQDVAAYVASVAGSGSASASQPSRLGTNGKTIFSSECASCHTLKAAGATGTVGPNLDQLKPPFAIARRQVTNGGAVMPAFKGKLTPQQIDAVAKFVSSSAGK